jgi:hypothetical protein
MARAELLRFQQAMSGNCDTHMQFPFMSIEPSRPELREGFFVSTGNSIRW